MMKIGFDLTLNFALKQSGDHLCTLYSKIIEGMEVLGEDGWGQ